MKKVMFFIVLIWFSKENLFAQVARDLDSGATKQNEQNKQNKDELLQEYYKLSNDPELFRINGKTTYKGKNLGAIQFPVGGIGTGCIQYNGDAIPRYWQIFNNMGHDFIPNSFLAIREKSTQGIKVRALQTKKVGSFKAMESLEAEASFPFLKYTFQDSLFAKVSMEVYNPFIPTNLKDSGIPAVFYKITIENPTNDELEISLLSSQQNAVGYSKVPILHTENGFSYNFKTSIDQKYVIDNKSDFYGGNINDVKDQANAKILYMSSNTPKEDRHFGQMALILFDNKNIGKTQGIANWNNEKTLYRQFEKTGQIKGKTTAGESEKGATWTGALNTMFKLKAGEKRVINLALAWYFPNGKNGGFMDKWDSWGKGDWEGNGNKYAVHWKNIKELTTYITANHERLLSDTEKFSEAFYSTNLPYWAVERMGNLLAILKSRTIFHDKNDYVGLWEGTGGVDGSCAGNCNHVWHYAQSHARLFPEMGRLIRNQTFDLIKENGQIPYRQPAGSFAFDGQCGDIMGAYREHLMSPDNSWLNKYYPAIKKAMNYLIEQYDDNRDGWLSDRAKHTTYDASMTGNPSFLSSMYLAALRASVKMALVMNDTKQAREWEAIADSSSKLQNEKLWNGEYFIQLKGEKHATDYDNGCHADQLLGQWWADQTGLGSMYEDYKIKSASEAILKYNFKSHLRNHDQGHRTFALPEEAGVVVTVWPDNNQPAYASGYSGEVWTTFEYTIASSLLKYDRVREALTLLRSGYNRYDGRLRTGYIGKWGNFGFSGNPFGDDECGQFYGRALSNWSVLLAAQGFDYNGPEQFISFNPKWKPDNHISFFSTSEGWGNFSQKRTSSTQENKIELAYGKLALSTITLAVDVEKNQNVSLTLNGRNINASSKNNNGTCVIDFDPVVLHANDILKILTK